MIYVFAFIGIFILVVSVGVYFLTRRWGHYGALATAVFTLVALVLCWPIPGHGTFTFLGEAFFHELRSIWKERQEKKEEAFHEAFLSRQAERFAERLPFEVATGVAPGWQRGMSPEGFAFWIDEKSGLIWSDALSMSEPIAEAAPDALLAEARRTCAEHPPRAHWALPTDAEGFFLWRNGGDHVMPRRPGRFVSERVDTDFEFSIPVIQIVRAGAARSNTQQQPEVPWAVRCVALGATAPRRGYLDVDIARDEWNAYQLAKLDR